LKKRNDTEVIDVICLAAVKAAGKKYMDSWQTGKYQM
jgi:hypothetical protein